MNSELIKKFSKQISKVLDEAATFLSYNGCNDIPEGFWEGLTEEDKKELVGEAYMEGIIDSEARDHGILTDVTVAMLFAKWLEGR